ncbi:hypothetical protein [Janthinobacterium sp. 75]|uniref:hypothetical protein n=1 Tax=Janthinobacterium sp. 75 TaxID=2135628 RepID=UPI0010645BDA|nr:hypothetical protein [Janthinobacterium sp. 75]
MLFANLKIERSAEGQFAADRETIVAQMQEMAATGKPPQQLPLETDARDGVEVPGLHNASIAQAPGIISLYWLLHAASRTVATACIQNQPADPRDFSADGQYQPLLDQRLPPWSVAWPVRHLRRTCIEGDTSHEKSSSGQAARR